MLEKVRQQTKRAPLDFYLPLFHSRLEERYEILRFWLNVESIPEIDDLLRAYAD